MALRTDQTDQLSDPILAFRCRSSAASKQRRIYKDVAVDTQNQVR
jgi:hypothetical protein